MAHLQSTTKVTIEGSQTALEVKADAGPDQIIMQGNLVDTLDGSGSENAVSYAWKQVSGPNCIIEWRKYCIIRPSLPEKGANSNIL